MNKIVDCKQYDRKAYNLILAGRNEIAISEMQAKCAEGIIEQIKELEIAFEEADDYEEKYIKRIIYLLEELRTVVHEFDEEMEIFIEETIAILKMGKAVGDLSVFPMFCKSFGRSQQYVSFVKSN